MVRCREHIPSANELLRWSLLISPHQLEHSIAGTRKRPLMAITPIRPHLSVRPRQIPNGILAIRRQEDRHSGLAGAVVISNGEIAHMVARSLAVGIAHCQRLSSRPIRAGALEVGLSDLLVALSELVLGSGQRDSTTTEEIPSIHEGQRRTDVLFHN